MSFPRVLLTVLSPVRAHARACKVFTTPMPVPKNQNTPVTVDWSIPSLLPAVGAAPLMLVLWGAAVTSSSSSSSSPPPPPPPTSPENIRNLLRTKGQNLISDEPAVTQQSRRTYLSPDVEAETVCLRPSPSTRLSDQPSVCGRSCVERAEGCSPGSLLATPTYMYIILVRVKLVPSLAPSVDLALSTV
ncbi:unnamed protein product [Pleuronectes platessa]|uniref:Uncharacterized protein n=1 Tax=Pleuronectes platessa TaxID=8262 RepID=A0A9N7TWD4_PLEPL|nr:unnamed protein product [Pleuronectes platessa]